MFCILSSNVLWSLSHKSNKWVDWIKMNLNVVSEHTLYKIASLRDKNLWELCPRGDESKRESSSESNRHYTSQEKAFYKTKSFRV